MFSFADIDSLEEGGLIYGFVLICLEEATAGRVIQGVGCGRAVHTISCDGLSRIVEVPQLLESF